MGCKEARLSIRARRATDGVSRYTFTSDARSWGDAESATTGTNSTANNNGIMWILDQRTGIVGAKQDRIIVSQTADHFQMQVIDHRGSSHMPLAEFFARGIDLRMSAEFNATDHNLQQVELKKLNLGNTDFTRKTSSRGEKGLVM